MLRVHFSSEDLGRVRMIADPDPHWETVLSLQVLQTRLGGLRFDPWRRAVRARCREDPQLASSVQRLLTVSPNCNYFPDFLTPPPSGLPVEAGIDTVQRTARGRMRRELGILARYRTATAWTRRLADGEVDTVRQLGDSLRRYYDAAIAPYQEQIRAAAATDQAARTRTMLGGGADALLAGLRPIARWRPPVLETDFPVEQDLQLGGRGLLLVPSYFCCDRPVTLADGELPPVLVYPVTHLGSMLPKPRDRHDSSLSALLGKTRATVLHTLGTGASTGELARRAGIAPASASEHARVLREAGLISSHRETTMMLHTLTPLGKQLLDG